MFKLNIRGYFGRNVTYKLGIFRSAQNSDNFYDILDCRASSGQTSGIKTVYFDSSNDEDYADINIIHQISDFVKTGNFLRIFFSVINSHQLSKIVLKIYPHEPDKSFLKKNSNRNAIVTKWSL